MQKPAVTSAMEQRHTQYAILTARMVTVIVRIVQLERAPLTIANMSEAQNYVPPVRVAEYVQGV